ncbi:MAG: glucuronate isomerase [Clostridiales bacterium]|nr:glucuronate isomerase [Clostridiales bacterium]
MDSFSDNAFMLKTKTARELFEAYAKDAPIIDYHCHLDAQEIDEDMRFENIAQLWLRHDHYKWRLMRAAGIEERLITGDASDREKFDAWVSVLSKAVGNPLFHWSHMELKRCFGFDGVLSEKTADEVWSRTSKALAKKNMGARGLISAANVELLCTTDDPVDSLEAHQRIQEDSAVKFRVLPAFRPDRAVVIEKPEFFEFVEQLEDVCKTKIAKIEDLEDALRERMDYFAGLGCRLSDHGMERFVYEPANRDTVNRILCKRLAVMAGNLSETEIDQYKTAMMLFFARADHELGWTMQVHFGAGRDVNSRMNALIGPNSGFDCISGGGFVAPMAQWMDALEREDSLPRMIIYSLNPNDNVLIDSLIACFQKGPEAGRLQHGSAWWFNDHDRGIREQLQSVAENGYLPSFVGMLTDSRSYLSFVRHEYFRRILCDMLGQMIEDGLFPDDRELVGDMIGDICYRNVRRLFAT